MKKQDLYIQAAAVVMASKSCDGNHTHVPGKVVDYVQRDKSKSLKELEAKKDCLIESLREFRKGETDVLALLSEKTDKPIVGALRRIQANIKTTKRQLEFIDREISAQRAVVDALKGVNC